MMYEASVPVLSHFIRGLQAILRKADAHCAARKIDPNALLSARLFPDMFPLTKQVQLVSDFAKGIGARLSGATNPSYADEEKTFEDLQARLEKTLTFLGSLKKDQFADAATKTVTIKVGGNDMNFSGGEYLMGYALPNFYFHLTTAYNILRHNGLDLGKKDFMGRA